MKYLYYYTKQGFEHTFIFAIIQIFEIYLTLNKKMDITN